MEVYVIRHSPVAVGKDVCYGQADVALAESFALDAEEIKQKIPTDFDAVFCSPSERCKKLAAVLPGKNIVLEPALMEMNFGDWENKKWDEIDQQALNEWMSDFVHIKPPNGENLTALYGRVKNFLDTLSRQPHQKVLLITHAGVVRCVWAYVLEIPLQNIFKIPVDYGQVFAFRLHADSCLNTIKRMM